MFIIFLGSTKKNKSNHSENLLDDVKHLEDEEVSSMRMNWLKDYYIKKEVERLNNWKNNKFDQF